MNPLAAATAFDINTVGPNRVVFTIDLIKEEGLRDANMVEETMMLFKLRYRNIHSYTIEYSGDYLVIAVSGIIKMSAYYDWLDNWLDAQADTD